MSKIAVIGAGTMGNGIAHVFAMKGHQVHLIDISESALEKAILTIAKNLDRMVKKEKISEAEKRATIENISTYTDLAEGVKGMDLVVEAATENVALKLKIFKTLNEAAPKKAILASNTCLLYTSPSPRDRTRSRMPSSA